MAASPQRTLDARPDTLDFRDTMYVPTLVEVPPEIPLEAYLSHAVPVLDQGKEGACTGFGLATVAHYLLKRRRSQPDATRVSPRMIYQLAKRYDEWPGEDYSGSSARGAMKGWHKHGICAEKLWPYDPKKPDAKLTLARTADAVRRPLGAYFRVNHKDLVAMHAAISEVGVLYATGMVHAGWNNPGRNGVIPYSEAVQGGHAFAIVAYDREGFWIQNSWGEDWGRRGFARVSYDDWLANGTDTWVARLGAPVTLTRSRSSAAAHAPGAGESVGYSFQDLRPHIVSIGNDGVLKPGGDYGTTEDDVREIFRKSIPAAMKDWKGRKHILLYGHGGLTSEALAAQRVADYREALLEAQVYPVALVWHSDYWTTVTNILRDALSRRRPEGFLDNAKDFMLDRLDDAMEPVARALSGKAAWDEMKENALAATESTKGGARFALNELVRFLAANKDVSVHLVGHSAGSILHAPIARYLKAKGVAIETCTLWAPACTVQVFDDYYRPLLPDKGIRRFAVYALKDKAEQDDDCAGIYHKSLLYLVSNAFEAKPRIPLARDGIPLLGMQKFIEKDGALAQLFRRKGVELVLAPNGDGGITASTASHHGDFDNDEATVRSTLARIVATTAAAMRSVADVDMPHIHFHKSASRMSERRAILDRASQRRV